MDISGAKISNFYAEGIESDYLLVNGSGQFSGDLSLLSDLSVSGNISAQGNFNLTGNLIANAGSFGNYVEIFGNKLNTTALTVKQINTGDILNLYNGTTEVFTVTQTGNVGIGTSEPSSKFQIYLENNDNNILSGITLTRATTADPANGIGNQILFQTEDARNQIVSAAAINSQLSWVGDGSTDSAQGAIYLKLRMDQALMRL